MSKKNDKWEMKMQRQRELRKKGVELLFERVSLLVSCYDDKEFQSHCAAEEVNELDMLDAELADVAVEFLTLKAVLDQYPQRKQWVDRPIRELIAEVLESASKGRKGDRGERISWKDRCLAAEKKCEQLSAELSSLRQALELVGGKRSAA